MRSGARSGRWLRAAALALCLLCLPAPPSAPGAAAAGGSVAAGVAADDAALRGRTLYESSCTGCHGRSVHDRSPRSAGSLAALRSNVQRWSEATGTHWSEADLDDVVTWLNQRYYHFPCAPSGCTGRRAGNDPAPGRRPA